MTFHIAVQFEGNNTKYFTGNVLCMFESHAKHPLVKEYLTIEAADLGIADFIEIMRRLDDRAEYTVTARDERNGVYTCKTATKDSWAFART